MNHDTRICCTKHQQGEKAVTTSGRNSGFLRFTLTRFYPNNIPSFSEYTWPFSLCARRPPPVAGDTELQAANRANPTKYCWDCVLLSIKPTRNAQCSGALIGEMDCPETKLTKMIDISIILTATLTSFHIYTCETFSNIRMTLYVARRPPWAYCLLRIVPQQNPQMYCWTIIKNCLFLLNQKLKNSFQIDIQIKCLTLIYAEIGISGPVQKLV